MWLVVAFGPEKCRNSRPRTSSWAKFRPAVGHENSHERLVRDAGSQRFLDKLGDPGVCGHRQVLHHMGEGGAEKFALQERPLFARNADRLRQSLSEKAVCREMQTCWSKSAPSTLPGGPTRRGEYPISGTNTSRAANALSTASFQKASRHDRQRERPAEPLWISA